jgi:hypothetical protein
MRGPHRTTTAVRDHHKGVYSTKSEHLGLLPGRALVPGHDTGASSSTPTRTLVNQVLAIEPYASARRVSWVVDNGLSHPNRAAAARLSDAWANAVMVHLPVHASSLNQVEIYFSVI